MHNEPFSKKVAHVSGKIGEKRFAFIVCLVLVFFVLFTVLSALDLVPEAGLKADAEVSKTDLSGKDGTPSVTVVTDESPVRIVASTINLDVPILNPDSRNVDVLDTALLKGAVRYPGSSAMADSGTMFLFGHSSNVPIVHNQFYKTFNNLKNLESGDLIHVQSKNFENVYRVISVTEAPADEVRVDLTGHGKRLVLSTCDSFGGKNSRYVVEAVFVASYSLSSTP